MRVVDARKMSLTEMRQVLRKKEFDAVELGPGAKRKNKEVFGAELTAAQVVDRIVGEVRAEGDASVVKYTRLIDGVEILPAALKVTEAEFRQAYDAVDPKVLASLRLAIKNVTAFHTEQKPKSWITYRDNGVMLGQNCRPLDRVGIYVPGGTAAYPSSVVMNAVPARVAGVREIYMAVPPGKDGKVNPYVLVAAQEIGVTAIYKVGGAQAIAALAFGTETIPRVDKITGPGNIFVTLAKKAVYGHVDIDMLAGPSEIMLVADTSADPVYVAADLLSQAEHDVLASSVLVTDDAALIPAVQQELEKQTAVLARREIIQASLDNNGLMILASDIQAAVEIANQYAPEHLELMTASPFTLLPYVRHAGAVFLGRYTPEPVGDYLAGPDHILPTGGTAHFYSVLNVETFMKKSSIISYTESALQQVQTDIVNLAETEGLTAHANAVKVRMQHE